MIYCRVGKCPADLKSQLCCIYCVKVKSCPNVCKKRSLSCNLADEVNEIKKRAARAAKV